MGWYPNPGDPDLCIDIFGDDDAYGLAKNSCPILLADCPAPAPLPASGAKIPTIGGSVSNMSLVLPRPVGDVRNELPTPLSFGPQPYSAANGFEPDGGSVGGGVLVECDSPGEGLPRMAERMEYSRLAASEPKGKEGSYGTLKRGSFGGKGSAVGNRTRM